jgi:hypothetical protein
MRKGKKSDDGDDERGEGGSEEERQSNMHRSSVVEGNEGERGGKISQHPHFDQPEAAVRALDFPAGDSLGIR